MAYCQDTDLYNRYGSPNVGLWADMEGLADHNTDIATQINDNPNIASRIAAACNWATARFEALLRGSELNYSLPLVTTDPVAIDITVKLAGYWLSTARGVRDYDEKGTPLTRLQADYNNAMNDMLLIATGKLKLAAVQE